MSDLEDLREGQGKHPQEGGKSTQRCIHSGCLGGAAWDTEVGIGWRGGEGGGSWRGHQGKDKVTKWTMEWSSG